MQTDLDGNEDSDGGASLNSREAGLAGKVRFGMQNEDAMSSASRAVIEEQDSPQMRSLLIQEGVAGRAARRGLGSTDSGRDRSPGVRPARGVPRVSSRPSLGATTTDTGYTNGSTGSAGLIGQRSDGLGRQGIARGSGTGSTSGTGSGSRTGSGHHHDGVGGSSSLTPRGEEEEEEENAGARDGTGGAPRGRGAGGGMHGGRGRVSLSSSAPSAWWEGSEPSPRVRNPGRRGRTRDQLE